MKDTGDSWEQHFDKISIEERSKFDEETLYNLEGIKRKKRYSRKPDGFRNEYIVVCVLLMVKFYHENHRYLFFSSLKAGLGYLLENYFVLMFL